MPAIVTYNNSTIATVNDSATLKTKGTWSPYDIVVRDVAVEDSYAIAFIDRTISSIPSSFVASVTSIGSYAFASCYSLTTVSFPKATSIGSYAFYYCQSLATASFPSATTIGSYAFGYCSALTTASFPNVTTIGSSAFFSCSALTTASFPNVTSIGRSAFGSCVALTAVSFPSVSDIGSSAFHGCYSLTTASFPSATTIGSYAFGYCSKLSSLYLMGSSVASFGASGFVGTPMSKSNYLGYFGSIYVPASLLTAYQTTKYLSIYSARIVGV